MPKTVLHTYSNHKWTGPADHALNLAAWLARQGEWRVLFACGRRRGTENPVHRKAGERGLERVPGLRLDKHLNWRILPDILALRRICSRRAVDLVHSHQDNDALTAVLAGRGGRLIRTIYDGEAPRLTPRRRFVLSRTARIFAASGAAAQALAAAFPGKPVERVDIPVDLERFRPQPKDPALCREFGIAPGQVVGGIVARVQRHRRFEVLIAALKRVAAAEPGFKFLIIGRGTHIESVAVRPVRQSGLAGRVVFTGYRRDDYVDILNLLDYKVMLHPGSDGACRAAREALACGKPVIAGRVGILPELVDDGGNGMLVESDPAALAEAILTIHRRTEFRERCARGARAYAEAVLDPRRYVERVAAAYRQLGAAG
jgi:glycosyltransferase involved in cell wall biosynthesis